MSGAGAVPIGDGVESPGLKKSITGPLSFTQLNAIAIMIIFAASDLVTLQDLLLFFFSAIYILIMSKFAFPATAVAASNPPKPVFSPSRLFVCYVSLAAVVGLVFPLVYIFGGIAAGHKAGILAAAPHVFLLSAQIFWEGVTVNSRRFSLPTRAFVPIFYNTRRVFTIFDWLETEFSKERASEPWNNYGRALAVANLVFWCFNLFCFLLPVYLPRAFRKYYEEEASVKMVKDK
ncbi:hypothetical protein SUGI_0862890 [Cryptomeria japonica]|uniref:uncharacterized protein LOC131053076 n=1 Tax=Cryptomeria japonica TaxID=3369 RepID=UPI002414C868|nr:uncharacterized protein LOC131053076 [Cryptomeria japonica]GLJ41690.1 hypothetical protein SUGI_0862890 [Cryptomeria japonica]